MLTSNMNRGPRFHEKLIKLKQKKAPLSICVTPAHTYTLVFKNVEITEVGSDFVALGGIGVKLGDIRTITECLNTWRWDEGFSPYKDSSNAQFRTLWDFIEVWGHMKQTMSVLTDKNGLEFVEGAIQELGADYMTLRPQLEVETTIRLKDLVAIGRRDDFLFLKDKGKFMLPQMKGDE